jgi:biotin transport system permease protein
MYHPTGSAIERWPVGVKYLVLLALTIPCFIVQRWWLTLAALLIVAAVLAAARLGLRRALGLTPGLIILVAVLVGFHTVTGSWLDGVVVGGNIILAMWAARLVTMTTPAPVLVDALVSLTRPLRRIGFNEERFGLAVLIMVRSIPYLAGSLATAGQAVAARGLRGQLGRQITQVVVRAVGYAQATGDAMTARGLGDGAGPVGPGAVDRLG